MNGFNNSVHKCSAITSPKTEMFTNPSSQLLPHRNIINSMYRFKNMDPLLSKRVCYVGDRLHVHV